MRKDEICKNEEIKYRRGAQYKSHANSNTKRVFQTEAFFNNVVVVVVVCWQLPSERARQTDIYAA